MNKFGSLTASALAVALVVASSGGVDAQQVYRWVDASGRVQYSDTPPPVGTKNVQEKNVSGSSIQNNELPLAAADAQKKNPVTIYVSECGEACDAAKAYLGKRGIPHTVVDPTRTIELNKKFKDETGGSVVPVMKVGEKRLSGWSESAWASALDTAGYPKTASFSKPKPVEDRSGLEPATPKNGAAVAAGATTATNTTSADADKAKAAPAKP